MLSREQALTAIDIALLPASDLYVHEGVDRERYLSFLEADLLQNLCEPFEVHAKVWLNGGEFDSTETKVRGYCVAHRSGTWLLYQPETHRFIGARGDTADKLYAHPCFASPLASWAGSIGKRPAAKIVA
jgi:hypothetical protein